MSPYRSKKQSRWAFATKQPWAKRWADETDYSGLPEHALQFGGYGLALSDALDAGEPAQEEFTSPMVERAMQTKVGEQPLATGAVEPAMAPWEYFMGPAAFYGRGMAGKALGVAQDILDPRLFSLKSGKALAKSIDDAAVDQIKQNIKFTDEYLKMLDEGVPGKQLDLFTGLPSKQQAIKALQDRGMTKKQAEDAVNQLKIDWNAKPPYRPVAYDEDAIPRGTAEMEGFQKMMKDQSGEVRYGKNVAMPVARGLSDRTAYPGDAQTPTSWLLGIKNKHDLLAAHEAMTTPAGRRQGLIDMGFDKDYVNTLSDTDVIHEFSDMMHNWAGTLFDRSNMVIGNTAVRQSLPRRVKDVNRMGGEVKKYQMGGVNPLQAIAPQFQMQMPNLPAINPVASAAGASAGGAGMAGMLSSPWASIGSAALGFAGNLINEGTAADKYGRRSGFGEAAGNLLTDISSMDPGKIAMAVPNMILNAFKRKKINQEADIAQNRDIAGNMKQAMAYSDPVMNTYEQGQQMNSFNRRGGLIPYPYQSQMRRGIQPAVQPTRFLDGGNLLKEVFDDDDYFEDLVERPAEGLTPRGKGYQTFRQGGDMMDLAFHPRLYSIYAATGEGIVPRGQGYQTFQAGGFGDPMQGFEEREIPADGGSLNQISDNAYTVQGNQPNKTDDVGLGNGSFVDHGEFIKDGQVNMQVFSDTLKVPGGNKTFADVAKSIEKMKPKDPDDPRFQGQVAMVEKKLQELFAMQQIMNGDSQGETPAEAEAGMPQGEDRGRGITLGNAFEYGGLYSGNNPVNEQEFFNLQNLPDWRKKKRYNKGGLKPIAPQPGITQMPSAPKYIGKQSQETPRSAEQRAYERYQRAHGTPPRRLSERQKAMKEYGYQFGGNNPISMQTSLNSMTFAHPETGQPVNYWDYKEEILKNPKYGNRTQRMNYLQQFGKDLQSGKVPEVTPDQYQSSPSTQMPGMERLDQPVTPQRYIPGSSQLSNYYHGGIGDKMNNFHPATASPGILPSVSSLYPKARFSRGGRAYDKGGKMRTLSQPVFDFGAYAEELASEAGHEPGSGVGFATGGQLAMGTPIEASEHHKSMKMARKIAMDHLREDPNYYTKLKKAGLSHGGVLDALGDDVYMLFGVQEPDTSKYPKAYKKGGVAAARKKPGGSNVGKDRKTSKAGEGPFVGPSGGAPAGSYPIKNKKQWKAAKAYARHAPDPSGIRAAADRVARRRGWLTRNGGLVPVFLNGGEGEGKLSDLQWDPEFGAYMLPGTGVEETGMGRIGAGWPSLGVQNMSAPDTLPGVTPQQSLMGSPALQRRGRLPNMGFAMPYTPGLERAPDNAISGEVNMDGIYAFGEDWSARNPAEEPVVDVGQMPEEFADVYDPSFNDNARGLDYWTQFLPDAANLLNILTLPKVPVPDLAKKTSLEEFDNRDLVNKIMQSERSSTQAVQQNMSQQGAAAANVQNIHANTINQLSTADQQLRNMNAQIRNQEAQLNQQIEALNTGVMNKYKQDKLERLLAQRRELSALASNVGNKIANIQKEKNMMRKDMAVLDLYAKLYGIPGVYERKMKSTLDQWEERSGVAKERNKVQKRSK